MCLGADFTSVKEKVHMCWENSSFGKGPTYDVGDPQFDL